MTKEKRPINILLAEEDDDDAFLTEKMLKEMKLLNNVYRVRDGEELMDFLKRRGQYESKEDAPFPALILLDLNMPKKDGREALKEIKNDPDLRDIAVTVLTTSEAEEDIVRTYDLGVNSFVSKPVDFDGFAKVIKDIGHYWFEVVELPRKA